jgi:acetate kinase
LPASYRNDEIERYGFHGLSYAYLMQQLGTMDADIAVHGRVVLAHLGNGASLAAVQNGQCVDTTMSFTPASGIMMSTRSGDIDPGVLYYLCKSRGVSLDDLQHSLNHGAGMLGVSGVSGDIRKLLEIEGSNANAALAIAMFCYQIRKCIGAYAAALGGLDTLVFAGGIGENSAVIRSRICEELAFIGIRLDSEMNDGNHLVISSKQSIPVRVIRTDEELMIANLVMQFNPNQMASQGKG